MIIKNLAARCRRRSAINIFSDKKRDIQWIGDGSGIYPMYGIPWMSEEQAMSMLDIPEKKRTGSLATSFGDIESFWDVSDGAADNEAVAINLPMFFGGKLIYPVTTSQGIAFYDADTFSPIKDCESPKLYERYDKRNELYFVAKSGMMVEAVIRPEKVKLKALLERMNQITTLLAAQAAVEEEEET